MSKYKRGKVITSLDEFAEQTLIFDALSQKIYHAGWVQSWQFRYVKIGINKRRFYKVEVKGEQK